MNILKLNLFLIALLSCNLTKTAAKPTLNEATITSNIISSTIVAATAYCMISYIIQEDQLVEHTYPQAQAWYDTMAQKYPQAHLNEKLFLQNIFFIPKMFMPSCASFNQIYFPQESLKDINYLYQKGLDGVKLTEEENIFMNMQEFLLLHEAGHIEHNDHANRFYASMTAMVAIYGSALIYKNNTNNNIDTKQLLAIGGWAYFLANMSISRYQEANADKFAYQNGELATLLAGISFFENEKVDGLYNIENKKLSPFIKTDSPVGILTQSLANCVRVPLFCIEKGIKIAFKSTDATTWLYHYLIGSTHPSPSARAQAIRDEISRRLESSTIQAA